MPTYKITITYVPDKSKGVGSWCSVGLAGNASWVLTRDQGMTITSSVNQNPLCPRGSVVIDAERIMIEGFADSIEVQLYVQTDETKLAFIPDSSRADISTLSLKSDIDVCECPPSITRADNFSLRLT